MEKINFSCNVKNTSDHTDLALEFWLDGDKFFDNHVKVGNTCINYQFDEDEADHCLSIVLKNKAQHHTKIDESGSILSDAVLTITDITFDDIQLDQIVYENAVYTHSYNGTGEETKEKFFGTLGCNGKVEFNFYTPFFMFFLEKM